MNLAYNARRNAVKAKVEKLATLWSGEGKKLCEQYLKAFEDREPS